MGGAVLVTASVAALIYGLGQGQQKGFGAPGAVAALAAAVALAAAFAAVERRRRRRWCRRGCSPTRRGGWRSA